MADDKASSQTQKHKPPSEVVISKEKTEKRGKSNPASASEKGKNAATSKSKEPSELTEILNCLVAIRENQKQSDNRLDELTNRMETMEQGEYEYYDEYEVDDDFVAEQMTSKTRKLDEMQGPSDENQDSPFFSLSKRFKTVENTGNDIDNVLAKNVTDLFRKGMDDDQYEKLTKDENTPRPNNCEGLKTVKMNKLVWDVMSASARTNDYKLQKCANSVVKAAVILTRTFDEIVKMNHSLQDSNVKDLDFTKVIEGCNDSLALLGHSNYQSCMLRRDLLKPELKKEYSHLCTHSIPYTDEIFGDDVSKTAKEIEETSRMGYKMQQGYQPYRGAYRARPYGRGRFRGRPGHMRGRGYGGPFGDDQRKNSHRRGSQRGHRM